MDWHEDESFWDEIYTASKGDRKFTSAVKDASTDGNLPKDIKIKIPKDEEEWSKYL